MRFCTCNLILNRGIWIIYLATIQLGTSLVFTFYHQGHWMSLHSKSNTGHMLSARPSAQSNADGGVRENVSAAWTYIYKPGEQKRWWTRRGWWLSVAGFRSHTGQAHSRGERRQRRAGLSRGTRTGTHFTQWPPMFTADKFVSFQQLWGKLNLRKCSFFSSIRPNNNTIPTGLRGEKTPSVFKGESREWISTSGQSESNRGNHTSFPLPFFPSFAVTCRQMRVRRVCAASQ